MLRLENHLARRRVWETYTQAGLVVAMQLVGLFSSGASNVSSGQS